jgi:hypothetical protein
MNNKAKKKQKKQIKRQREHQKRREQRKVLSRRKRTAEKEMFLLEQELEALKAKALKKSKEGEE